MWCVHAFAGFLVAALAAISLALPSRRALLGPGTVIGVDTVLLFAGATIMAATAAITSSRYGDLPEIIPIHFGLDGTVNRYGPRSMAWLLVAMQVAIAMGCFAIYAATGTRGVLVLGVCTLAIFWRVQLLILSAATAGEKRAPIGGSVLFIVVALAVGVFAATRG
jgi:hypothetical protein